MFCSLIASRKNCSNSSYSVVYNQATFAFRLIDAFSKAKNVSMRLKSDKYKNKRAKMTLTSSHIRMRSSFQWIRALSSIKINLHMSIKLADEKQAKNQVNLSSEIFIYNQSALRKHLILYEIIENDCSNAVLMNLSRYIIVHDESRQDALFFEFSQILTHRENYVRRDSVITTIISTLTCSTFIQKDQLFSSSIIQSLHSVIA